MYQLSLQIETEFKKIVSLQRRTNIGFFLEK